MEVGMTEDEAKFAAPLMQEARQMLRMWEEGDPEVTNLWKTMNGWVYDGFEVTYRRLGVAFDKVYYESDTYLLGKDIVLDGLEQGTFFRKPAGSAWIDLRCEGLVEQLLLRADVPERKSTR